MELIDNYSVTQPEFSTFERHLGQKIYTINYNVRILEEVNEFGGKYQYNSLTLPINQYDRGAVISAVIRQRYSDDEMQAIINNYLLDPNDAEAVAEFNEMQDYRKFAKSLADDFEKAIAQD